MFWRPLDYSTVFHGIRRGLSGSLRKYVYEKVLGGWERHPWLFCLCGLQVVQASARESHPRVDSCTSGSSADITELAGARPSNELALALSEVVQASARENHHRVDSRTALGLAAEAGHFDAAAVLT